MPNITRVVTKILSINPHIPNIHAISGVLFTLRIQFEYTQTQCDEGARDSIDILIWGLLFFGQTTKCFKLNSQLLKGEEQDDLFFVQGRDTDIQYGCSTKFRGEFWTFGGRGAQYKNQVKLKRKPRTSSRNSII